MTTLGSDYVRRQVEARFYGEALYFGALELARAPTAELHFCLGLATCGAIGASADVQRILRGEPPVHAGAPPMAGNRSLLVYEGFFHLIESARRGLCVPDALIPVGLAVLADLESFLREDFKGFVVTGRKYSLREATCGAAAVLRRLLREAPPPSDEIRTKVSQGEEVVDAELGQRGGDASFYDVVRVSPDA